MEKEMNYDFSDYKKSISYSTNETVKRETEKSLKYFKTLNSNIFSLFCQLLNVTKY